jgi:hypothetical protein
VKRRCPGQRLCPPVPLLEVTLVTDPEMAPMVETKKAGQWIHASLIGAMTLGLDFYRWPHPIVGGFGLVCQRFWT